MAHLNFKSLFGRIEKAMKTCSGEQVLVILDNWNVLANSCDSDMPELDLVESFNELL